MDPLSETVVRNTKRARRHKKEHVPETPPAGGFLTQDLIFECCQAIVTHLENTLEGMVAIQPKIEFNICSRSDLAFDSSFPETLSALPCIQQLVAWFVAAKDEKHYKTLVATSMQSHIKGYWDGRHPTMPCTWVHALFVVNINFAKLF